MTRVAGQQQEYVEEFVFGPPVWLRRSGGQGRLQGWREALLWREAPVGR